MKAVYKIFYAIPWLAALFVLAWLVSERIPLSGVKVLSIPFDGKSPWFDPFLPGQRVSSVGLQPEGWVGQKIFKDPVYASLRLPGVYKQLRLGLVFRPHAQPIVEIGGRQEPISSFAIQPLWSKALSQGWEYVEWKGKKGYVQTGSPASLLDEEDMDKLLVWHASTTAPEWMDGEERKQTFNVALRGAHDLHVVPVKGRIHFEISLQDMNRGRQKGTVVFSLSKNGELLWSEAMSLAGSRDARPSQVYEKIIDLSNQAPGVYKLAINADDDIFIRRISSPLRRWVLGPRLYFADQIGYATSVLPGMAWTNARHLLLETLHKEGKQTVSLGGARVELQSTHTEYRLDRHENERAGAQAVQAPAGDVRMIGDGYFALSPDLLFLPAPRRLTDASDPIAEGVKAILTPYQPPRALGDGWYEAFVEYPLEDRPGTFRLALATPGMSERKGRIDIRAAHLTYTRASLDWRGWFFAVWREMASAWHKL